MTLNKLDSRNLFNCWGEFLSSEYESKFQVYKWRLNARRLQFVCLLSAIGYLSGIIVDFLDNNMIITLEFWIMSSLRVVVFFTGILLTLFVATKKTYSDFTYLLAGYMIIFGIAESISVVIDNRIGLINDGVEFFVIIVLLFYLFLPPRVISAIIGGSVSSVMFIWVLITQNTLNVAHNFTISVFLVLFNLFGYFFLVNYGRMQRNEFRVLEEERALNEQLQITKNELEQYYRLFAENTIDVIYLYRLRSPTGFQYVSPSIRQLAGYEPDQFTAIWHVMRIIHPDDRDNFRRILKKTPMDDGDGFALFRILNKNNIPVWVEHRYTVVEHPDGKNLEGIIRNVTKRVLLEQNIARLDRLNIAGQMAASLAHEIRNPITTVQGYLQFFRNKQYFSPYKGQMDLMINELERTNSIISEYLALSKNKSIEVKKCNLNDIVLCLYPLIQTQAVAAKVEVCLQLGEVPELYLDDKEIKQLVLNLTRNAIEAMPSGGIVGINTVICGDETILSFKDQGKGIADYIMQNLGKPFITTKDSGTGLGMAICYQIISRHQAKIDIYRTGRNYNTD